MKVSADHAGAVVFRSKTDSAPKAIAHQPVADELDGRGPARPSRKITSGRFPLQDATVRPGGRLARVSS